MRFQVKNRKYIALEALDFEELDLKNLDLEALSEAIARLT